MIRLSIIIPCYNDGIFLSDAIESVKQCPQKEVIEVIIVNDGSTDAGTLSLLHKLKEEGYSIIDQANQGLGKARNNGIAEARGEYFLPLDADNKIRPAYIDKGIRILDDNPKVGMVYGDAMYFGKRTGIGKSRKFDLAGLLMYNYIDACVVARKLAWQQVGGYDNNISPIADWDFNVSLVEAGWTLQYVPAVLFDYRFRNDSMIRMYKNYDYCIDYFTKKHANLYRQELIKINSIKKLLARLMKMIGHKFRF